MYRHSPVRNQRSKGIKTKHVVQLCLLTAVCFWLLFQVKRSHDKKKEFDANISLNTHATDETVKFGRKDLQPKLVETTTGIQMPEDTQEQEDDEEENKHDEEEQDEDKIEDGGGGGDDEIDEKSNMEIDRDEVDIIDEDKEIEESEGEEHEEKDAESETESRVEDGSTHEAREEHYKADDASSAVLTHDPENEIQNGTLDDNSSENVGLVDHGTVAEEKNSQSMNATSSVENPNTTTVSSDYRFDSNATVTNTTPNLTNNSGMLKPNGEDDDSESDNLETNKEDPTYSEGQNDLETMPEIETDTASE
ncbi:hypothetical protein HanRHA438_Chr16g0749521 [Helianthus annuus]|uniref:Uncharacterized protein n=1 Tax=Helianthus annuus TaxID=4232 RepID=A0A251UJV0_HELAN|nr:myelin transcription factor 1-like protein [Helianthus annuus]XP_021970746.1 myelin transcription factor 1-like protein [Helianthus annuus]KAF5759107.1 hypothetical protein HanXRQr2_Chr16g0737241 [Helianthus annuus]KAJ0437352.1 hypothetical protein HanHA300_Chr16g0601091 [Helianthus annuus]KAJ0441763.1 hypothetical protein HanIR_Chr16g0801481 [Helianthus annuus]KAJ0459667.1 hypothetical protein HanHA89_Chr16g0651591 [Helianthus annuus]KAJ0640148.1 hypothetical protein HanLR1_Chr16g0611941 